MSRNKAAYANLRDSNLMFVGWVLITVGLSVSFFSTGEGSDLDQAAEDACLERVEAGTQGYCGGTKNAFDNRPMLAWGWYASAILGWLMAATGISLVWRLCK